LLSVPEEPLYNQSELLARVAASDEKAFEAIVDRYWNKIHSIALLFTKSPELAKDIVQEVFMKLWTGRQNLPEVKNFEAWIFIVARNAIFNSMRKKVRLYPADLYLADKPGQSTLTPEEALGFKELQELIQKGVEQLPPQQKIIFKMSREQGISHEDICAELNLARSTVKNALVKALVFLRNYVQLHDASYLAVFLLLYPFHS
jgi:RNA polymerase sigma-70 factor (ECF subfamily)